MVFCGLFPIDGDDFETFRESLEKLKLNDASISYTPESSGALGFGFRCGFLGLLHMEIVKERLERRVQPRAHRHGASVEYPRAQDQRRCRAGRQPCRPAADPEHRLHRRAVLPCQHHHPEGLRGNLMELCQSRRGEMSKLEYLSPERVELHYHIPLPKSSSTSSIR